MSASIQGPAYRILTPHLLIRCWDPEDAPRLKEAVDRNRSDLLPWMPWARGEPEELDVHIQRLRRWRGNFDLNQDFVYGIFSSNGQQVLGGTGLHTRAGENVREIGYWIDKDYRNHGLATEASAALTRVAFDIDKVIRVEIHCHPDNFASAAVPRKLGFTHEATLRKRVPDGQGILTDSMIWTLLIEEYPSSPAAKAAFEAYDVVGRKISNEL